ncbi:MAG: hypothetical protein R6W79_01835, partial [Acidimicrobiia bacterium]
EPAPGDTDGLSLSARIAAADAAGESGDSLDAIRSAAMHALEEARSIKQRSFVETHGPREGAEPSMVEDAVVDDAVAIDPGTHVEDEVVEPRHVVHMDYSPTVAPPPRHAQAEDVDESEEPTRIESRYSRNSAKLPRIGVNPTNSTSTIANLRKQMTADN